MKTHDKKSELELRRKEEARLSNEIKSAKLRMAEYDIKANQEAARITTLSNHRSEILKLIGEATMGEMRTT